MAVRKVQQGHWFFYEGLGSTEVWCADTYEEAVEFQPKKLGPWRGRKLVFRVTIQPHKANEGMGAVFRHDKLEVIDGPETQQHFVERKSIETQLREEEKAIKKQERNSS